VSESWINDSEIVESAVLSAICAHDGHAETWDDFAILDHVMEGLCPGRYFDWRKRDYVWKAIMRLRGLEDPGAYFADHRERFCVLVKSRDIRGRARWCIL
jgi:hypothetical protein